MTECNLPESPQGQLIAMAPTVYLLFRMRKHLHPLKVHRRVCGIHRLGRMRFLRQSPSYQARFRLQATLQDSI